MTTLKHLLALTAAFGLLFVTGCSKKTDDPTSGMTSEQKEANAPPSADEMPAFMQQIPAETPYVFVGLKPVPEAIVDKMFAALEPALAMLQTELKNTLDIATMQLINDGTIEKILSKHETMPGMFLRPNVSYQALKP